jgi:hypothetical protein
VLRAARLASSDTAAPRAPLESAWGGPALAPFGSGGRGLRFRYRSLRSSLWKNHGAPRAELCSICHQSAAKWSIPALSSSTVKVRSLARILSVGQILAVGWTRER